MLERFGRALFGSPAKVAIEPRSADADASRDLLEQIAGLERAAATVYARHGLPDQPGQYRRKGDAGSWERLSETMSPADKWSLVQSAPAGEGWRFASLSGLGARSDIAEVRQAAAILSACQGLRQRLTAQTPISPQDLADAIRLGAAWRRLGQRAEDSNDTTPPLRFLPDGPDGNDA
ncbi:hypothetical protein [Brevundimonas sanguinis]|uniref:hypothetical protein n=1 Tax=Brevundimonas sanguinis TaxID=3021811 RepID=UPI002414ED2D|nr:MULTISPECIES: hypothetical protein [Brevundimonas]